MQHMPHCGILIEDIVSGGLVGGRDSVVDPLNSTMYEVRILYCTCFRLEILPDPIGNPIPGNCIPALLLADGWRRSLVSSAAGGPLDGRGSTVRHRNHAVE